jgi:hypothetical protein
MGASRKQKEDFYLRNKKNRLHWTRICTDDWPWPIAFDDKHVYSPSSVRCRDCNVNEGEVLPTKKWDKKPL